MCDKFRTFFYWSHSKLRQIFDLDHGNCTYYAFFTSHMASLGDFFITWQTRIWSHRSFLQAWQIVYIFVMSTWQIYEFLNLSHGKLYILGHEKLRIFGV